MRINKDALKAKANKMSKEFGISQTIVYNRFFFDAFLSRLSKSDYKSYFVLKGGLYLSSVLGINNRSTMDIDFLIHNLSMERLKIIEAIKEISAIQTEDGISFEVVKISNIRNEDKYGGLQINMLGKLDNVTCRFGIDVATGDPIVPSEKNYDYKCLVTGEYLPLKTYSLESVIAEKLETILARNISNSRRKDYYDLYILRKTQQQNVDALLLIEAFKETCHYRNFSLSKSDSLALVDEISRNKQIGARWLAYCKNVKYTADLSFQDVLMSIREWIETIF